jgi:formamidopyrimidine-DNA glycosylase
MPELPEVETICRGIASSLDGAIAESGKTTSVTDYPAFRKAPCGLLAMRNIS